MAGRSRRAVAAVIGRVLDVPPDTRPIGPMLDADPSSAWFAQNIHKFDPLAGPPPQARYGPPEHGIRTVDKRMLRYHDPMWNARHPRDEED